MRRWLCCAGHIDEPKQSLDNEPKYPKSHPDGMFSFFAYY